MKKCPICDKDLDLFEKRPNINNQLVDILICSNCFLLVNGKTRGKEEDVKLQEQGLRGVYSFSDKFLLKKEIEKYENHLLGLFKLNNFNPQSKIFFEFGFGNSLSLFAAKKTGFKKVYGVDITVDLFKQAQSIIDSEGVHAYTSTKEVEDKVDYVYMWHVLEHLVNPKEILYGINKISNKGCCLAIQVPQYKKDYICEVHHCFYTEKSIKELLRITEFKLERIEYDLNNEFMTVFATK